MACGMRRKQVDTAIGASSLCKQVTAPKNGLVPSKRSADPSRQPSQSRQEPVRQPKRTKERRHMLNMSEDVEVSKLSSVYASETREHANFSELARILVKFWRSGAKFWLYLGKLSCHLGLPAPESPRLATRRGATFEAKSVGPCTSHFFAMRCTARSTSSSENACRLCGPQHRSGHSC